MSLYLIMALILFQGVSGLFGGAALVADPSGEFLSMPVSMLEGSPFDNFLIPGFILFTVLGILPVVVFFGLGKRAIWAWPGAFVVSTALIAWIGVEIMMVGYHSDPPLQLIYGLIGLVLLGLVMLPSVRRALDVTQHS
ncbi:hypothetical protein [Rhodohalobacter mucosus]|uniref:hypothetical protein n=1 Tax=Rhodohalobacter mucosus TaxID=2079485 RepID=UPI0011B20ADF|nr:hypothetical protein [Rhodohalobacter mucosus]